ncbi:MAG: hypothetical protein ACK44P_06680 [Bacteroidota bacterium]|nr:hypothetical protein [Sphingobacteriales bacterium]
MKELNEITALIHLKVERLLAERNLLEQRLKQVELDNNELRKQLLEQKNTIISIEERNKIVKLAESLKNSGNSRELKKLLSGYIRDIDECIRLLSER